MLYQFTVGEDREQEFEAVIKMCGLENMPLTSCICIFLKTLITNIHIVNEMFKRACNCVITIVISLTNPVIKVILRIQIMNIDVKSREFMFFILF